MMSPARISLLPGGVCELVSTSPLARSRAGSLCRTGALVSGKYGRGLDQKRGITMEQLDKARDSTYLLLPSLVEDVTY
jgi:hypothetical protein